jgi:DNA-binding NarL/FixJ family response regulator
MNQPIKICIVDYHTLFVKALSELMSLKEGYIVSFDAGNANDLFQRLNREMVDIILMDIYFADTDGLKIIEELKKNYTEIKIIVISLCPDPDIINKAFELGIHGYISKKANLSELWDALHQVQNDRLFENKILKESLYCQATKRLVKDKDKRNINHNPTHLKILELLWQEKNSREIAQELFMSVSSIEKLKQQLKEESGTKSTIGLIKYALKKKLIVLPVYHANSGLI